MTDILLAKPQLQEGWIDWAVGESNITRKNLFKYFPSLYDPNLLSLTKSLSIEDLEYPSPIGFKPLVNLLEEKHQAPVIITNGAKQGLGAVFHALHQRVDLLWMQPIFWALLPPLAKAHNLSVD